MIKTTLTNQSNTIECVFLGSDDPLEDSSLNNLYLAVNFLQNFDLKRFPIQRKVLYEQYQQKSHEIFGENQDPLAPNLFATVTNTVMITHIQCMNLNSKKLWESFGRDLERNPQKQIKHTPRQLNSHTHSHIQLNQSHTFILKTKD